MEFTPQNTYLKANRMLKLFRKNHDNEKFLTHYFKRRKEE